MKSATLATAGLAFAPPGTATAVPTLPGPPPSLGPRLIHLTDAELAEVDGQLRPVLTQSDPIHALFPIRERDSRRVEWECDGRRIAVVPGLHGEYDVVTEEDVEYARSLSDPGAPIDVSELVIKLLRKLANRHYNRISFILWNLISTGTYTVPSRAFPAPWTGWPCPSCSLRTFTATIPWSDPDHADPVADFRSVAVRHGTDRLSFGRDAVAFANLKTTLHLLGFAEHDGSWINLPFGLEDYRRMAERKDLPRLSLWNEGYRWSGDDGKAPDSFRNFIPDDTIVLVGRRPDGNRLGEFQLTRHDAPREFGPSPEIGPAPLIRVFPYCDEGTAAAVSRRSPAVLKVLRGFAGGPTFEHPESVVVMRV